MNMQKKITRLQADPNIRMALAVRAMEFKSRAAVYKAALWHLEQAEIYRQERDLKTMQLYCWLAESCFNLFDKLLEAKP